MMDFCQKIPALTTGGKEIGLMLPPIAFGTKLPPNFTSAESNRRSVLAR